MSCDAMQIDVQAGTDTAVVRVDGDMAHREVVSTFGRVLRELVALEWRRVEVDLSAARWIGAATLGELASALRLAAGNGCRLSVTGTAPAVDRALLVSGLNRELNSRSDALTKPSEPALKTLCAA